MNFSPLEIAFWLILLPRALLRPVSGYAPVLSELFAAVAVPGFKEPYLPLFRCSFPRSTKNPSLKRN